MINLKVRHEDDPARIFVVDDHPIVREGLAAQLAHQTRLTLCGEASDAAEALMRVAQVHPDLVIVDISLKTSNGIDLVKRLKARDHELRILVWSIYSETLYAERALRAGALGFVHKGAGAEVIMDAIETVLMGKIYLSDDISARLLQRVLGGEHPPGTGSAVEALTDRELEAFEFLGKGLTTQQIAEKMHVSPKTVETYRARIKEKLNLHNAMELVQRAVQWVVEQC